MTILVPTDFSKLSVVAVRYACAIAQKLKADVILLSVITMNSSAASSIKWNRLEIEIVEINKQEGEQLIKELQEERNGKLVISYRYIMGHPVDAMIETFAVENSVDLIVMGTKGVTGLTKAVIGSNAAAVIDKSSRPVMVVPGKTKIKQIKRIVYVTDMKDLEDEIKTVVMFATLFKASIEVLHVSENETPIKISAEETSANLIKLTKYPEISFHVLGGPAIAEIVDTFVFDHKADILTLFTHKLGFYEKLFGKSITRQLTFHARLPLLIFNRTTLL